MEKRGEIGTRIIFLIFLEDVLKTYSSFHLMPNSVLSIITIAIESAIAIESFYKFHPIKKPVKMSIFKLWILTQIEGEFPKKKLNS